MAGAEQSSLLLLLLLGEAGEGALSEALQLLLLAEAGGQTDLLELSREKEREGGGLVMVALCISLGDHLHGICNGVAALAVAEAATDARFGRQSLVRCRLR